MRMFCAGFRTTTWNAWRFIIACCVSGSISARADDIFPQPPPEVKTYEWTLTPAPEQRFALQYKLIRPLNERVAGNAATHYFRAMLLEAGQRKETPEQIERFTDWFELPYSKLPVEEIKTWLAPRLAVLAELKLAAQCETCDWGARFQDLRGSEVLSMRLDEYQQCRQLARILRLKARVELAEKRFDDAFATIGQIYRLAGELGTVPSVIVNLIGIAVQALGNESLSEFIATEGSPNMYWALRGLPDPVVDIRVGWTFEWTSISRLFPYLNDADTAQRTPLEWRQLLIKTHVDYDNMNPDTDSVAHQARTMLLVMRSYPLARRELIAAGYNSVAVEQMPAAQVVAIFARDCNRYVADQMIKATMRPQSPTAQELRQVRERLERAGYLSPNSDAVSDRDPLKINTELGLFENLFEANGRHPRTIAALTAIEGIRMYAAIHDGKLPATLLDLTEAPAPLNPLTHSPLLYRVIDNRAELLIPPTRPDDAYSGRRFLFQIRK